MKPLQTFVALIMLVLLTTACSTSSFNNTRKIASVEIPPACQMNLPNPVTQITRTSQYQGKFNKTDIPNTAVTIACRNGKPVYAIEFSSAKGNSTLAIEPLISGGFHTGLYSEELGVYAQPITSKVGSVMNSSYSIKKELNSNQRETNTVRIQLDPVAEKKHKEFCEKTSRDIEIAEPTTHKDAYSCQSRLLPRPPISAMTIDGVLTKPTMRFKCSDGQPRYEVITELPQSREVEYLGFGISDGIIASSTQYLRFAKTDSGQQLVQNATSDHKINVLENGTIGFRLKYNRVLRANFDKEMLAKHQEWCSIGVQRLSYALPPVSDGTVTPQQTEAADDIVPLIEN